ncbi:hypothetical protein N0V84_003209 [Fusarium piperis]|uniref:DUF6590 domain-containing protein n=1 Tax=Fusarium piperis TaxID=1435070 RepID=A0A9W8WHU4_9HYPO|nr:hypothetical protein N0V84_003209 [Fusarium piperis]
MPTHAYYGSCRISKRHPPRRGRNERRRGTDTWRPGRDSGGEKNDRRDTRDRRDDHRGHSSEQEQHRGHSSEREQHRGHSSEREQHRGHSSEREHHRDRSSEREQHSDARDERDDDDSAHNNCGRVSQDRYNYNINIKSFGDNDRSKNWNGNVLRDRNFNTYVRGKPKRDRFDNRRYSPGASSHQGSMDTSYASRTSSWVNSESNGGSSSDQPAPSIHEGKDTDETARRERDERDDGYYGARQAYSDFSRGDVVHGHMRPTDRVLEESELRFGTIISTAIHGQAREDTVSIDEFNKSLSGFGIVYSKYRKLIVVEEWTQHVVCIPLYSYNGRGLSGREGLACEYFDVRDMDDPNPEAGDTFLTLMAIRDREWPRENTFIEGRTVAKLTEKITFYRTDKCSVEGRIDQESLATLIPPYIHSSSNPLAKMLARSQAGTPTDKQTDGPTNDGEDEKEEGEI